ncbi:hypothetical protein AB2L27_00700 [Kineococcus sp. LSe6-4]|uniref:Asp23/Gls24 family envelope stress response protein n=1 Tax=Kineococcus halophytocola TaxID=3234027 RepID=A0ABV4GXW2_9ACTN
MERLADDLAAVVLAVPGVSALHPGNRGEIGTYLPGRRVGGIRLREEAFTARARDADGSHPVEVHVVLTADAPVRQTAQAVHDAVDRRLAVDGLHPAVLVNVADLAADPAAPPAP